jgi:hypothetical protein
MIPRPSLHLNESLILPTRGQYDRFPAMQVAPRSLLMIFSFDFRSAPRIICGCFFFSMAPDTRRLRERSIGASRLATKIRRIPPPGNASHIIKYHQGCGASGGDGAGATWT